jgi:hypothetical protein
VASESKQKQELFQKERDRNYNKESTGTNGTLAGEIGLLEAVAANRYEEQAFPITSPTHGSQVRHRRHN